jgi:hypothetical protein
MSEEILSEINQEKFKRRLSIFRAISTRLIAIFLIIAILFVGGIQYKYAQSISEIKEKYGSLGYCYLCGQENLRKCECQYIPELLLSSTNISFYAEQAAENNIKPCPNKNSWQYKNNISINFTS